MIEKDLQNRVIAAIAALGVRGLEIDGNLTSAVPGEVAGAESPNAGALASIVTWPRQADDYGWMCPVSVRFSIRLAFRADEFPAGAQVADALAPILDTVTRWTREVDGDGDVTPCELETDGFMPGGVRADGGEGPYFDDALSAWRAVINFTIRGRIKN